MAAEVREDYLEALEALTVNSRPIIKTLTEIAQECKEHAGAVCDAIETHTHQCAPAFKLPALYLIDSICKTDKTRGGNHIYVPEFEPRIVSIFTGAFEEAPEPVRMKLSELFKTWTVPLAPDNQPLFSHDVLRQLNDYMMSLQQHQIPSNGAVPSGPPPGAPLPRARLTQSGLMVEINRLRNLLEQDPKDQYNGMQLSLLARYESEISGVVDPKTLPVMQNQIEEMKINRERHLNGIRDSGFHNNNNNANSNNRRRNNNRRNNNNNNNNNNNGRRVVSGGVDKSTGSNNVPLGQRKRSDNRKNSPLSELDPSKIDPNMAAELAKTLVIPPHQQEQFQQFQQQFQQQQFLHQQQQQQQQQQQFEENSNGSHEHYHDHDMDMDGQDQAEENDIPDVDLDTAVANDASPSQIDNLYGRLLPLQCATCGYRFPDTDAGREAKQNEMDWHFRVNKDIREGHSRNRTWFLNLQMWIDYRDENEVFGSGDLALETGMDANNSNSLNDTAGQPVDLEKERQKYIDVPTDSNAVCPVCQEPHEVSWSEEAENWVWMNAVEVQGHYFHATCYADPHNRETVSAILGNA